MTEARKLTFEDVWNSTSVFFVDEDLEQEIDAEVQSLLDTAQDSRVSDTATITISEMVSFLVQKENALDVVLKDIDLSEEKFMRIVSLLRKLGRTPGGLVTEWSMNQIKAKMLNEPNFANIIAELIVDGKRDTELVHYIPRYYLDTLNYREIRGSSEAARRIHYKRSLIGAYGGRKGYRVEAKIQTKLADIEAKHGIGYCKGRSPIIDTDIDCAVPSLEDPWVIIMSSFQETTSSGQTTKARDMLSAYERVHRHNSRYRENRVFINFVDGGGWLARKRDLERLVENCHYFINLQFLDMLESIILKHVPKRYFEQR